MRFGNSGELQTKSVWRAEWEKVVIPYFPRNELTLDCGCGPAYYRHLFGDNYVGLDVQRCFSKGGAYVRASATNLPFCDKSFDFVLASALFEHIKNPDEALSEICRVLKRGGCVLLSTPSKYGAKYETLKTYRGYDMEDLERLVSHHKLRIKKRLKVGSVLAIMFAEFENVFRGKIKVSQTELPSFEGEPYYNLLERSVFGRAVLKSREIILSLTLALDTHVPFGSIYQGTCILADDCSRDR
jgi:SAM-dependent methyltransferase